MSRLIAMLAVAGLFLGVAGPVSAESFHPLRTARALAHFGLNTAHLAVDLGLDTAKGAVNVVEDAVTPDNCRPGAYYKGANGRWHKCY
jgi:hypothetical protein